MKSPLQALRSIPLEAIVWFSGLAGLALVDSSKHHFTICPLALAGFDWCPGCGLGRAISLLFHGDFTGSLQAHPLGIFAVIILTSRIIHLTKNHLKYGPRN